MRKSDDNGLPDSIDGNPVFVIRRAHQTASAVFARYLSQHDLTSSQFCVLAVLSRRGPTGQNELGRLAHLDRCTTSVVIRNLKARKLVAAGRDERDSRKRLLTLTTRGRLLLPRATRQSDRAHRAVTAVLTTREARQLISTLKKLVQAHQA
jgi:DNA-binding MarR family transcriptional regulator